MFWSHSQETSESDNGRTPVLSIKEWRYYSQDKNPSSITGSQGKIKLLSQLYKKTKQLWAGPEPCISSMRTSDERRAHPETVGETVPEDVSGDMLWGRSVGSSYHGNTYLSVPLFSGCSGSSENMDQEKYKQWRRPKNSREEKWKHSVVTPQRHL